MPSVVDSHTPQTMHAPRPGTLDPSTGNFLRYDGPAGTVVFLVALPLCLGIALASEAPLLSGLVAGIVGGIVVSILAAVVAVNDLAF